MIKKIDMHNTQPSRPTVKKRGVVLLIAVLIAGVTLVAGMGVYNRLYKQLLFASFWKQAQIAFSAADSGIECIIYWDLHPASSASCFGVVVPGWNPSLNASANISVTTPRCFTVKITKSGTAPFTTIEARGYNTCDSANPRRVERGLGAQY